MPLNQEFLNEFEKYVQDVKKCNQNSTSSKVMLIYERELLNLQKYLKLYIDGKATETATEREQEQKKIDLAFSLAKVECCLHVIRKTKGASESIKMRNFEDPIINEIESFFIQKFFFGMEYVSALSAYGFNADGNLCAANAHFQGHLEATKLSPISGVCGVDDPRLHEKCKECKQVSHDNSDTTGDLISLLPQDFVKAEYLRLSPQDSVKEEYLRKNQSSLALKVLASAIIGLSVAVYASTFSFSVAIIVAIGVIATILSMGCMMGYPPAKNRRNYFGGRKTEMSMPISENPISGPNKVHPTNQEAHVENQATNSQAGSPLQKK